MTAGSHTKGEYVTQTLRRSRPNQANAGVDTTAMVTILTSRAKPRHVPDVNDEARPVPAAQGEAEQAGTDPREDVEVPPWVAHLHRHQALDISRVHEELQREAEDLVPDERGQGEPADQPSPER
jgi:hypothetical protein